MSVRLTEKFLGGERGPSKGAMPKGRKAQVDHWDVVAPGLGVRVTKAGRRSFVVWYRFNGKPRRDTLKPQYPALSLDAARTEANQTAIDVSAGRDPRLSGRAPRNHYAPKHSDHAETPGTFAKAVGEYVRRYQEGSEGNKTAGEVKRALLKFGEDWECPASEITARDIRGRLEAIRDGDKDRAPAPYMANRTHSYLKTFFSWCAEPGIEIVETSPMWGMKKPFNGEASRDRFYDDAEIAAIWKAADKGATYHRAIIKLMILTGKRKTALASMRWPEIDETGLWTPPPDLQRKRGNKRNHAIPLPDLALQIIRALPKIEGNDFVFPGKKEGQHLDAGTPLKERIREASGVKDFNFHAFRHTVKTGLGGLGFPPHIKQIALDHSVESGAGAGYDHYDYRNEKAEALGAWADHVKGVLVKKKVWKKNVIPMGG